MTNFNFIFDTICVPYIFRKSIFGWNCDHDTPLCDTPLLEDTPLCDTPDDFDSNSASKHFDSNKKSEHFDRNNESEHFDSNNESEHFDSI